MKSLFFSALLAISLSAVADTDISDNKERAFVSISGFDAEVLYHSIDTVVKGDGTEIPFTKSVKLAEDTMLLTCTLNNSNASCELFYNRLRPGSLVQEFLSGSQVVLVLNPELSTKAIEIFKFMSYTGDRSGTIYLNYQTSDLRFSIQCSTSGNPLGDQCSFSYVKP